MPDEATRSRFARTGGSQSGRKAYRRPVGHRPARGLGATQTCFVRERGHECSRRYGRAYGRRSREVAAAALPIAGMGLRNQLRAQKPMHLFRSALLTHRTAALVTSMPENASVMATRTQHVCRPRCSFGLLAVESPRRRPRPFCRLACLKEDWRLPAHLGRSRPYARIAAPGTSRGFAALRFFGCYRRHGGRSQPSQQRVYEVTVQET